MLRVNTIISLIFVGLNVYCQDTIEGSRDPWLWPFTKTSIWNMPIGSNAEYESANFQPAGHVGVDIQHLMILNADDPERSVLGTEVWGPGRCEGIEELGFKLQIPDDWIVPDAGNSPYGLTPNGNFALLLPNSEIVFEGNQISRCTEAGPVYLPSWLKYSNNRRYQSIKGNGMDGGGQGASGMSALGGTIRLGELINDVPIRHAIKINPWAEKYCFYSDSLPGFKWPAISADMYAKEGYGGKDPNIVMGSLLAIPPDISVRSLGITSKAAKKLFFAMQNYGVYFTEDAAWDVWDIIVERDVELEFINTYGFSMTSDEWKNDVNKLMMALSVVTNNLPEQIGGGGTPLQPYAPDLGEISTSYTTIKQNNVNIYPNPLPDEILYFSKKVSGKIYTIHGQIVEEFENAESVNLNNRNGIYILKIFDEENMITEKLVKK